MNRLYTKDNNPLFDKREFIKSKPQDIRNKINAKDTVSMLKEKKIIIVNTKDPLTDLPDKDAALFCDLVYNPRLWNTIYNSIYRDQQKVNLKDALIWLE
ncbi:hypothetical protein AB9G22_09165 [Francisella philomiragia]|uniref:hypothetical protein n=1 Tax=Francisella philomiragia TaxID=28110 RepID=UPI003514F902